MHTHTLKCTYREKGEGEREKGKRRKKRGGREKTRKRNGKNILVG